MQTRYEQILSNLIIHKMYEKKLFFEDHSTKKRETHTQFSMK